MLEREVHEKVWGQEIWLVNRDYAGKEMVLAKGKQCSLHAHKKKDETFYVIGGKLLMENDGERRIMVPGDLQLIMPNQFHRFTGIDTSRIIEFSTHHYDTDDSDNFRLEKSRQIERAAIVGADFYVTGSRGYLGRVVKQALMQTGAKVTGSDIEFLDLTDRIALMQELHDLKPKAIVHTAAVSDWLACEKNPAVAHQVNIDATRTLVEYCREAQIPMIHVSTDFIFDGKTGNYSETAPVRPGNEYGRTKFQGEEAVRALDNHLILRAGTFYGVSYAVDRPVFVNKIIRALSQGQQYKVAVDEISNPTLIQSFAEAMIALIGQTGTWNIGGASTVNRYELAQQTARAFGLDESLLVKSTMAELGTTARPQNCSLDLSKLNKRGIYTSDLHQGLARMKEAYEKQQQAIRAL
jgi:dTDP-4-dehydrorhamnose reductase